MMFQAVLWCKIFMLLGCTFAQYSEFRGLQGQRPITDFTNKQQTRTQSREEQMAPMPTSTRMTNPSTFDPYNNQNTDSQYPAFSEWEGEEPMIDSRSKQPNPTRSRGEKMPPTRTRTTTTITTTTPSPTTIPPPSTNSFYEFNRKLLNILGPPFSKTNMIYSPISLQILLSFIYTGAENETAQELRDALEIPEMPGDVARLIRALLQQTKRQASQDLKLNMVNNMYYSDHLTVNDDFCRVLKPYFDAKVEATDFEAPSYAAARINKMVADKTEQRIQDLIKPETLNRYTQAILVNAIYLKAKWEKEFSASDTQIEDFHVTKGHKVPAKMMYMENHFNYGEFPGLNAKAIEVPFSSKNLSMLIILPNDVDGLENLEIALARTNLNELSGSLRREEVTLHMPLFQFEFEVDMTEALLRMGVTRLFLGNAQLHGLFRNQNVRVNSVQHKAYIKVNEGGVEAAAASFGRLHPLSLPLKMKYFIVNHPFVFVIRSPDAVYFIGHVTKPSYNEDYN